MKSTVTKAPSAMSKYNFDEIIRLSAFSSDGSLEVHYDDKNTSDQSYQAYRRNAEKANAFLSQKNQAKGGYSSGSDQSDVPYTYKIRKIDDGGMLAVTDDTRYIIDLDCGNRQYVVELICYKSDGKFHYGWSSYSSVDEAMKSIGPSFAR